MKFAAMQPNFSKRVISFNTKVIIIPPRGGKISMEIATVVLSLVGAVVLSILTYLRKYHQSGEEFDPVKLGVSAVYGLGVGVVLMLTGVAPTEENIVLQLAAYGGLAVALENVVRGLIGKKTE